MRSVPLVLVLLGLRAATVPARAQLDPHQHHPTIPNAMADLVRMSSALIQAMRMISSPPTPERSTTRTTPCFRCINSLGIRCL